MTNWFQTHNINPIYGWGPSKRMIVQGGHDTSVEPLELVRQARAAGCVYVEIRCFEDYSTYRPALEAAGFMYEPHYDVHISLTPNPSSMERGNGTGKGEIPMWIHESKRRQIRAAMAEGQTWREVSLTPQCSMSPSLSLPFDSDSECHPKHSFTPDGEGVHNSWEKDIEDWYACLKKLYRTKVKRPIPSLDWFRTMILEKGCKLLVVEASLPQSIVSSDRSFRALLHPEGEREEKTQKQIVGGVLLAVEDDLSKAYEWYICGQVMSTWAAIDWCRQHGVQCFDTMGAGKPDVPYGVRDFKLQMGGTLHEFGRYRCVLKPRLYRLGEWMMRSRK